MKVYFGNGQDIVKQALDRSVGKILSKGVVRRRKTSMTDTASSKLRITSAPSNSPYGGEGAAREVDGERAPEVKVVLAFRACEVEGERPSLGVAARVYREPRPLTPVGHVVDG